MNIQVRTRDTRDEVALRYVEEGDAFVALAGAKAQALAKDEAATARGVRPVTGKTKPERFTVIVIGGGQAGLSVGYLLRQRGIPFVILDRNERVGDSWRKRWESLRLFTPARYDGLVGMRFPAPPHSFPTKNEMADYLEAYAARFELPVRNGVKVDKLSREGDRYVVTAGNRRFEADHVVVAMANYQEPKVPSFAEELDPGIVQLHSREYRNPSQLRQGGVVVVGGGNSGAEIALEASQSGHRTWMSGRETGHLAFRIDGLAARLLLPLVARFLFHRVLTTSTRIGRKALRQVASMLFKALITRTRIGRKQRASAGSGSALIRTRPKDLAAAGVERLPRTVGVQDGLPILEDGRVLDVANVVWCTGFHPGFSWIDLPIFGKTGAPKHERGIVANEPGLYFVGLHFLYAMSSSMVHGVGRDARYVVKQIASRVSAGRRRLEARVA